MLEEKQPPFIQTAHYPESSHLCLHSHSRYRKERVNSGYLTSHPSLQQLPPCLLGHPISYVFQFQLPASRRLLHCAECCSAQFSFPFSLHAQYQTAHRQIWAEPVSQLDFCYPLLSRVAPISTANTCKVGISTVRTRVKNKRMSH